MSNQNDVLVSIYVPDLENPSEGRWVDLAPFEELRRELALQGISLLQSSSMGKTKFVEVLELHPDAVIESVN